jgi:RNA polymerase sigma-70 factor (ECF subfamily)
MELAVMQRKSPEGAPDVDAAEQLMSRRVSQAVKRAQLGDREALGFLYARYADNVHGYVRSIVHDSHEAEDVTQQVFAKLIRVIGKYEEREVPFFAWVLRVGGARGTAAGSTGGARAAPLRRALAAGDRDAHGPLGRLDPRPTPPRA